MISVVLPTYNGIDNIRKSIDSVLDQSYKDIELIIVDDCSTDGTGALVDEYAATHDNVHVIHNEKNRKLPASLNIGFSYAKGDYYTWTSDDNYFAPEALARMYGIFQSDPNADIVYTDYYTIDSEDKITGEINHKDYTDIFSDNIIGACFLYKKEVHEKLNGYDEGLFLAEDYDFWIRAVINKFKIEPLYEKLYYYRLHKSSLTGSRMPEIARATNVLYKRILQIQDIDKKDRATVLKKVIDNIYNWEYDRSELRRYLAELRAVSPEDYDNIDAVIRISRFVSKDTANRIERIKQRFKGIVSGR